MCLLKTDPVFSVPSWSFFFSWIENQIRHWLCPVLSVSVVWGGFTFWESNLEVFSQCPFPTVLIQTLSERLRNGEFDWILTTFLSFLDSRRRGHSIFFCSNMWRLHVKNRHLFQQATVPQKSGESTHNQTQLSWHIRIQPSLEPKIDETPMLSMLSSRLLVSPQQSPTSAGCGDGRLPSLKSHRDINNPYIYVYVYIYIEIQYYVVKKTTIILQASKILQIMIGFIPIS